MKITLLSTTGGLALESHDENPSGSSAIGSMGNSMIDPLILQEAQNDLRAKNSKLELERLKKSVADPVAKREEIEHRQVFKLPSGALALRTKSK